MNERKGSPCRAQERMLGLAKRGMSDIATGRAKAPVKRPTDTAFIAHDARERLIDQHNRLACCCNLNAGRAPIFGAKLPAQKSG